MNTLSATEVAISDYVSPTVSSSLAWPAASGDGIEPSSHEMAMPRTALVFRADLALAAEDMVEKYSDSDSQIIKSPELVILSPKAPEIVVTSVPIEIWEGVVTGIEGDNFSATIRAKMNSSIPDHVMDIDLISVQPQDRDLVNLGSVFYLTMYRETTGNTVKNVEEIRFRRKPDWTPLMIAKMKSLAAALPVLGGAPESLQG